jgi:hypothetical protein
MKDPRPGVGDFAPREKEHPPLDMSKSWKCDWDLWLVAVFIKIKNKITTFKF